MGIGEEASVHTANGTEGLDREPAVVPRSDAPQSAAAPEPEISTSVEGAAPLPGMPTAAGPPATAPAAPSSSRDTPIRRMAKEIEDGPSVSGRWVELVFDSKPRPADDPVIVFHHIRKTAGTALKRTIMRSYEGGEMVMIAYPEGDPPHLRTWWKELFNVMTEEESATLRAVSSHSAGYAIDLVPGRSVGVTMVRDPIDQVLSRWFMRKSTRDPEQQNVDGLRTLYEREVQQHKKGDQALMNWFNPQARTLLEPHFDLIGLDYALGPPADANLWRARLFSLLSRRFVVGVQDAFDDSVRRFSEEFGWVSEPDVPPATAKVNPFRPRSYPIDEALANTILAANWLDMELHAEYWRAFAGQAKQDAGRHGATRGPGYVIEKTASDGDEVSELRKELEQMRERLGEESQALRLRLRSVELELARARAKLGIRDPLKREKPVTHLSKEDLDAAKRRRKRDNVARRREGLDAMRTNTSDEESSQT